MKEVLRTITWFFQGGPTTSSLSIAVLVIFFATGTLLPSTAALKTGVNPHFSPYMLDGGEDWLIPYEDDSMSSVLATSSVFATDDGVLANPTVTDDTGVVFEDNPVELYEVKEGDTIQTISEAKGISVETIKFNNNLTSDTVKVGQKLNIAPVDGVLVVLNKSMSIAELSEEYEVELQTLADYNDMTTRAQLMKGERLVIPGEEQIAKAKDRAEKERQRLIAEAAAAAAAKRAQQVASTSYASTAVIDTSKSSYVATTQGKKMRWPSAAPVVTQGYRYGHPALDIAYTSGDHTTAIVAALGGTVVKSQGGWNGGYGNMIVIDHGGGLTTRYAHMRELYVSVGQYVNAGQSIGWMGRTGNVYGRTGLHLHFEVMQNGRRVNPYAYL